MKFLVGKGGRFGQDEMSAFRQQPGMSPQNPLYQRRNKAPAMETASPASELETEPAIPWDRVGGKPKPMMPPQGRGPRQVGPRVPGSGAKFDKLYARSGSAPAGPPKQPPPAGAAPTSIEALMADAGPGPTGDRSELFGNTLNDRMAPMPGDEVSGAIERQRLADEAAVRQYMRTEQNARDDKFMAGTMASMATGALDGGIGLGALGGGLGAYGGAQYQTQDPLEQAAWTAGGAAFGGAGAWAAPKIAAYLGPKISQAMGPAVGEINPGGATSPGYFGRPPQIQAPQIQAPQLGQGADEAMSGLASDYQAARMSRLAGEGEVLPRAPSFMDPPAAVPMGEISGAHRVTAPTVSPKAIGGEATLPTGRDLGMRNMPVNLPPKPAPSMGPGRGPNGETIPSPAPSPTTDPRLQNMPVRGATPPPQQGPAVNLFGRGPDNGGALAPLDLREAQFPSSFQPQPRPPTDPVVRNVLAQLREADAARPPRPMTSKSEVLSAMDEAGDFGQANQEHVFTASYMRAHGFSDSEMMDLGINPGTGVGPAPSGTMSMRPPGATSVDPMARMPTMRESQMIRPVTQVQPRPLDGFDMFTPTNAQAGTPTMTMAPGQGPAPGLQGVVPIRPLTQAPPPASSAPGASTSSIQRGVRAAAQGGGDVPPMLPPGSGGAPGFDPWADPGVRLALAGAGLAGGTAAGVGLVQSQDGSSAQAAEAPYAVPLPYATPTSDVMEPDASYPVGGGSVGGVPMSEFGALAPMWPPDPIKGSDYGESNPPRTVPDWSFPTSRGALDTARSPLFSSWRMTGDKAVRDLPYPGMPRDMEIRKQRAEYDRWADSYRLAGGVPMSFYEWRAQR